MSDKMQMLKGIICRELDDIAEKGELSAGDLDAIYKLIISKEKLLRIEEIEEDMGYSNDGDWNASGTYARDYRPSRNSYARGRHYVRGHYSYAGNVRQQMEDIMNSSELTSSQRSAMQRIIDTM